MLFSPGCLQPIGSSSAEWFRHWKRLQQNIFDVIPDHGCVKGVKMGPGRLWWKVTRRFSLSRLLRRGYFTWRQTRLSQNTSMQQIQFVCEQATKSILRNDGNTSKSRSQLEEHWSSIHPNDPFFITRPHTCTLPANFPQKGDKRCMGKGDSS